MSVSNRYLLMIEQQQRQSLIEEFRGKEEVFLGAIDIGIDDLIAEELLTDHKEEFFLINEELTDREEYEADRMRGSGHDFYHRSFVSQHPLAEKAFYGQERHFGDKRMSTRMPITLNTQKMEPHQGVKEHLDKFGYKTNPELYQKGLAEKTIRVGNPDQGIPYQEKTVQKKIGSVLDEFNAPDSIKKAYMNDPSRSGSSHKEFDLVLSHHQHDVYGMSTGRGWVSCSTMRKGCEKFNGQGPGAQKMKNEINGLTHVAYLVPKGGNVDKDAIARLAFKHHTPIGGGKSTLIAENRPYGQAPNDFQKKASEEVGKLFPIEQNKIYTRTHDVYDDSGRHFVFPKGQDISSDDVDAAWKTLGKNDETGRKQLYSILDPQKSYKSKKLNSIAKTVRDAHSFAMGGDFIKAHEKLGDLDLETKEHYRLTHHSYSEDSPVGKHLNEIASKFDHSKPEHLELFKNLNERWYGNGNETQQEIIRMGARRVYQKPIKTAEDAANYLSFVIHDPNTRTMKMNFAENHSLGKYPFKKIASHLAEKGQLNNETASRLYMGLPDGTKRAGNFYDHVSELVRSEIPGASQTMDQIAKERSTRNEGDIASTLHYTKPENREMWANAFGVDHKELLKKWGPSLRKKDREMRSYIDKKKLEVTENNT